MKHTTPITIRTATPADIRERGEQGIRDLFNRVRRDERHHGRSPLAPPQYRDWARAMTGDHYQALVAEKGGAIVGFCLATHLKNKNTTTLNNLFTAPETHGLGRAFIEAVRADAAAHGKTAITLTAEAGKGRASGFYKHLGFKVISTDTTPGGVRINHLKLNI